MHKRLIVLVSLIFCITLLAGCIPMIEVSGRVVNQNGTGIRGIIISCNGKTLESDDWGNFSFRVANVEYATTLSVTFDGTQLGFDQLTRTITIYPETDAFMGSIALYREKALVHGSVTSTYTTTGVQLQGGTNPQPLQAAADPAYPEGEIIVKFRDDVAIQSVDLLSTGMEQDLGVKVQAKFPRSKFVKVKTTKDTMQTIAALQKRADVEFAEPDYFVYPLEMIRPQGYTSYYNDPYYDDQWNLQAINIENAWKVSSSSSDIRVAVLDTGIGRGLNDLDARILWGLGYDFVDDDADPSVSYSSHGTYVASIIGAIPNNYQGIAGVLPSVGIVPIRILRDSEDGAWGKASDLIRGLEWAIYDADAHVINLSVAINVSGNNDMQSVSQMIQLAEQEGAVVVAAAGNSAGYQPTYPARHPNVLAVGAVGPTLQPAAYSNRGVDVFAPGGDEYVYPVSKYNGIIAQGIDGLAWVQGTSYASAHVAGIAALILANEPWLTPGQVRARIVNSSLDLCYDEAAGLVDAYRAVTGKNHGRIFVFFGEESWSRFTYQTEESTYTYVQDNRNHYQLSNVNPGTDRSLYAWVDRDDSGTLSYGDLLAKRVVTVKAGDELQIDLNLGWY